MSVPAVAPPLTSAPVVPLATCLHDLHTRRRRELRAALEPARAPDASVWLRWGAARFIKHLFTDWLEPERAAVEVAADYIAASQTAHLWMEAELVAMLGWQLDHAVGLCHRPAEFDHLTLKLETVLEHWCREVEDAFARLDWTDLSDEQRQAFAVLVGEESYHVN